MAQKKITRREMLKWIGTGSAAAVLAGCAPAQPGGQTGAADSTSADAPADQISLTIATYAGPNNDWQRHFAQQWADANANVELQIDEAIYGEMAKKQLTLLATGTLWDVSFSGIKWFPFSAAKGAFLALDDFISANDPGMDDFFDAARIGGELDGKNYGLPYLLHPGNPALVVYNKDILGEKGLSEPHDDMTTLEYADLAAKASDPDNQLFGTNYLPGNYYDFASLIRAYGEEILVDEGKTFNFAISETAQEAARWITELRTVHRAAPNRDESEGLQFAAGNMATRTIGSYAVRGMSETVGDKFEFDFALHPVSPDGGRGYSAFVEVFSVFSGSEHPGEAFDLITDLTSTEAGVWAVQQSATGNPTARKSVWETVAEDLHPVFGRALTMMQEISNPFPMPHNLRFSELQDQWANFSRDVFYGDVPFDEGMEAVQQACQEIMDLPRPS